MTKSKHWARSLTHEHLKDCMEHHFRILFQYHPSPTARPSSPQQTTFPGAPSLMTCRKRQSSLSRIDNFFFQKQHDSPHQSQEHKFNIMTEVKSFAPSSPFKQASTRRTYHSHSANARTRFTCPLRTSLTTCAPKMCSRRICIKTLHISSLQVHAGPAQSNGSFT
jgi:hypothetical protein